MLDEAEPEREATNDGPNGLVGAPEPAAEPVAEPVADSVADSVAEPVEEAVAEPMAEPVEEPVEEPVVVARTRRPSRFDRPKPPHDWRWVVAGIGRVLISTGILMFGFVAYQLWGTALQTAAAQNRLENEFEDQAATLTTLPSIEDYLATLPDASSTTDPASTEVATSDPSDPTATTSPTGTTDPTGDTTPSTGPTTDPTTPPPPGPVPTIAPGVPAPASPIPTPAPAAPIAQLRIPSIGVDWTVLEGVSVRSLRDGPAHFAETPLPGQFGNAAIAGHRTTYGQPFWSINEIQPGDEISVDVLGTGTYYYVARETQIIDPGDYAAVIPTYEPTKGTLTLVSCEPRFSTRKRIIVIADLDLTRGGAVPTLPSEPGVAEGSTLPVEDVPDKTPAEALGTDTAAPAGFSSGGGSTRLVVPLASGAPAYQDDGDVAEESEDVFSAGWFSDKAAWPHVAWWGLLLTLIALGSYWVSRKARRNWVGALVGIVPFTVTLYFFYENVNRLLPPAL